jgi:phospholipid/cholesterol/gamma-HCH transport system ATP-binding protein
MTVLENVCFPIEEHRPLWKKNRIIETAKMKLNESGMTDKHFQKQPSDLSGGQRKRVGLARSLALDPEIILYDEPTTGLDPILTAMVDELIQSTHKKNVNSTTIVVTHDLNAAFRIGDFIVMLDKGRVLLEGDKEVFTNSEIPLVKKFLEKGFKRKQ